MICQLIIFFLKFPDADKENSYHGGPKSLKVIGFLDRARVPFGLLLGNGTMVFQSTEGDAVSFHSNLVRLKQNINTFVRLNCKFSRQIRKLRF